MSNGEECPTPKLTGVGPTASPVNRAELQRIVELDNMLGPASAYSVSLERGDAAATARSRFHWAGGTACADARNACTA